MITRRFLPIVCVFLISVVGQTGGSGRASTLKPTDSWPTYSGDYSGRRYSHLEQINQANVKNLTLAWVSRVSPGTGNPPGWAFDLSNTRGPTIVGGEGTEAVPSTQSNGASRISGAILQVDGVLYFSTPDNAWAMDARTGRMIWHFVWKTKGGTHIGNRGMAIDGNSVLFETPDDYLVSLDARNGHERWHKAIADFNQQYFSTMAPVLIGSQLMVGSGNDFDAPGFLKSMDPESGNLRWTFWTTPHQKDDPGSDTWPNLDAARHGGGNVWMPGSYDAQLHLYYFGTGNPNPNFSAGSRPGANLFTSSIIALNVETGKMAWYFQLTPHSTHDSDASVTPILVDGQFNGTQRRLLLTANKNGYFFVLDRLTGTPLLAAPFSKSANWAKGVSGRYQAVPDPEKDPQAGGALVSPADGGITNWPPASFDPETGLFYVQRNESFSEYYITDPDPKEAQGYGGALEQKLGTLGRYLTAIDYQTGRIVWQHSYPNATNPDGSLAGLLSTAGKLLFGPDANGNLIAYDPANGRILWHTHLGQVTNAAETYLLDGRQYILTAAGDTIYAFTLNP